MWNNFFESLPQVSLCVKRLVYQNEQGEEVKGVCSNFLCKYLLQCVRVFMHVSLWSDYLDCDCEIYPEIWVLSKTNRAYSDWSICNVIGLRRAAISIEKRLICVCWLVKHIGDLKPGEEVAITGPVGKEMLMPKDPNATIIMVILLLCNQLAVPLYCTSPLYST